MIRKIRELILENTPIIKLFNKMGGIDYAIYNRNNVISGTKFINHFTTTDGAKYKVDGYSNSVVEETRLEYDWSDIRKDDIVLDIGANIGGFTIGAALKAQHVYAIEPIFYKELEENIKLNALSNVTIMPFAIGNDNDHVNLSFNKIERKNIPTHSLTYVKQFIWATNLHNISFLKCDSEGGEWFIKPIDLDGIRRIEMEVHPTLFPTELYNPNLISIIKQNWNTVAIENKKAYMLHAYKK